MTQILDAHTTVTSFSGGSASAKSPKPITQKYCITLIFSAQSRYFITKNIDYVVRQTFCMYQDLSCDFVNEILPSVVSVYMYSIVRKTEIMFFNIDLI